MNWLFELINHARTWWSNNHERVMYNVKQAFRRLGEFMDKLTRNIIRLMIIGIILNVIANYFWPDFPEKFPAIYGWFDCWLQFGEFAFRTALNGISALFTGHWSEFFIGFKVAFQELLHQFGIWFSSLGF